MTKFDSYLSNSNSLIWRGINNLFSIISGSIISRSCCRDDISSVERHSRQAATGFGCQSNGGVDCHSGGATSSNVLWILWNWMIQLKKYLKKMWIATIKGYYFLPIIDFKMYVHHHWLTSSTTCSGIKLILECESLHI